MFSAVYSALLAASVLSFPHFGYWEARNPRCDPKRVPIFDRDHADCVTTGSLLTYYINGMNGPCWPGYLPFIVIPEVEEGGLLSGLTSDRYYSGDEVATYIEVGGAYDPDGMRIGDLGPERLLLVETIHIDITQKAAHDPNYEVSVQDIEEWICEHGLIPPRSFVIFNTGWSFKRGNRYYGPEEALDLVKLGESLGVDILSELPFLIPPLQDFAWPGLSAQAAQFLLDHFCIIGVGIDTPSLDAGFRYRAFALEEPESRGVRRFLASYGMYLVMNVLLLDIHLPARGIFSTLGVFHICKGTRAPVNIYVEYCVNPTPEFFCELDVYRNIVLGVPGRFRH